jgi:hypothetical protein
VALVGLGLVTGLASSGLLSSTWFALLLIAAGALLLWRRREAAAFPPQVRGGPGPRPSDASSEPTAPASIVVATAQAEGPRTADDGATRPIDPPAG